MSSPSVIVIGAGVVGLSLSWHLLERNADVTVVASPDPNEEIGWASVAWSNASSKVRRNYPEHYVALNAQGVDATRDLAAQIGGSWLTPTGTLEIVAGEAESSKLAADVNRLSHEFSYPSEIVTHERVAELAPDVILRDGETAAFFEPDACIDASGLVSGLSESFGRNGGRIRRDRVVGLDRAGDVIERVQLEGGSSLTADVVVLAAGAWTPDIAALGGIDVPMLPRDDKRVIGLIAAISCPESALGPMVLSPDVLIRPSGPQRALVGSDHESMGINRKSTRTELLAGAQTFLSRARSRSCALDDSIVLDVRVGIRALSRDGLTIAGAARNAANAYILTTHSGFTLAPILGRLAAEEICRGVIQHELAPYRPSRFQGPAEG